MQPRVYKKLIARDKFLGTFQPLAANLNGAPPYTTKLDLSQQWNIADFLLEFANLADLSTVMQIRLLVNNEAVRKWNQTDNTVGFDLDLDNQYQNIPSFASTGSELLISMMRSQLIGGTELVDFGLDVNQDGKLVLGGGQMKHLPAFYTGSPKELRMETTLNCGSVDPDTGLKISSVSLEIDFASTGATAPSIQLYARTLPPMDGGPGTILRTDYKTFMASAGTNTMSKGANGLILGDPLRQFLNRIFFVVPNGVTLDNFQMQYNTESWLTRTDARNRYMQARYQKFAGATLYVLDFAEENYGDTPLEVWRAEDGIDLQFTCSAQTGIGIYQEFLGSVSPAR